MGTGRLSQLSVGQQTCPSVPVLTMFAFVMFVFVVITAVVVLFFV